MQVYLKSQLNCLLLSGRDNWEVSSWVWEGGSYRWAHRCAHLFPCGKKLELSVHLPYYLIFVRNVNSYSPDRVPTKNDRNMDGNGFPEQDIKAVVPGRAVCQPGSPSLWGITGPLIPKLFSTHQDEPQEPQESNKVPPEDTEADELWASLEAAAKRKLPDFELTPGSLPTRRRKKRPGSASP